MSTPPEIAVSGIGLFTSRPSRVEVRPASGPTGIRFIHSPTARVVPALIAHQQPARGPLGGRNTTLRDELFSVATVEHLLSALAGLGLWHADIVIDAEELPILDGSAAGFVSSLRGVLVSPHPARAIRLNQILRVEDPTSGAWIEARPADRIRYRYELRYPPGAGIPEQSFQWEGDADVYANQIAPARTFSLEREAVAMKAAGLFPHLTPRDMLVIAPDGHAIDNALRFPDEPARHKLLDLIGDLALAGPLPRATVVARRSGHALNQALAKALVEAQR